MKFNAYISAEGLERLALGNPLYSWHMGLQPYGDDLPKNAHPVGVLEFEPPSPAECVAPVLAMLAKREQDIQAEAYKDVQAIQERRENLLSLTYTAIPEAKESEL